MATYTLDLSDFDGYIGTGSGNDATALKNFNVEARAYSAANPLDTVHLTIPEGDTVTHPSRVISGSSDSSFFASGIKKLIVEGLGTGATLYVPPGGWGFGLGAPSGFLNSRSTVRINSVAAGSRKVVVPSAFHPTTAISGVAPNGNGAVRLTVGSTAGFEDVTYASADGTSGNSLIQWINSTSHRISVVDATHVDLVTVSNTSTTFSTGGTFGGNMAALFAAGDWVAVCGVDIQGLWKNVYGQPPNPHFFEYAQIESVNLETGVIVFTGPLRNTYLDTWPNYNAGKQDGGGHEPDQAGPATIMKLNPLWDAQIEYRNLTINQEAQAYCKVREVTFKDMIVQGTHGLVPTANKIWRVLDSTWAGAMEIDKVIDTIFFDNVICPSQPGFQSSSTNSYVIINSDMHNVDGTPKRSYFKNTTIDSLKPGAYAYGASTSVVADGCTIRALVANMAPQPDLYLYVDSLEDGVITVPNTAITGAGPTNRFLIPGHTVFWAGTNQCEGSFRILDVTQDETNIYVQTDLTSIPLWTGAANQFKIRICDAPELTFIDCEGEEGDESCVEVIDLCNEDARGQPIYSYSFRSHEVSAAGNLQTASDAISIAIGEVVSVKVNVTQAATTANPLHTVRLFIAGEFGSDVKNMDSTVESRWTPIIDLKATGERVISGGGVAVMGTQSLDSGLALPYTNTWIVAGMLPKVLVQAPPILVNAIFTIEVITDQGIATITNTPKLGVVTL